MRHALTASLAALALFLAACGEKSEPEVVAPANGGNGGSASTTTTNTTAGGQGGGGGGQKATPEDEVEDAAIAVLGGGDVGAACTDLVTERYVKSAYGDAQGCKAAVSKQGSFSVSVSDIQINGSKATAKAKPAAGPNKGETIKVELVEEGGTWKVDSAVSNAPAGP
ncbi:MAG: hypothetical protein ACHQCI_00360 [Solirubrobacterales bacterium]|jgi:hypothetical protein